MISCISCILVYIDIHIHNKIWSFFPKFKISAPSDFFRGRLFKQGRLLQKIPLPRGRLFGRGGYLSGGANSVIYGICVKTITYVK